MGEDILAHFFNMDYSKILNQQKWVMIDEEDNDDSVKRGEILVKLLAEHSDIRTVEWFGADNDQTAIFLPEGLPALIAMTQINLFNQMRRMEKTWSCLRDLMEKLPHA